LTSLSYIEGNYLSHCEHLISTNSWDLKSSVICAQANEGTVIHSEHLIYTNHWDFKLHLLFGPKEMFFNTLMKEKEDYMVFAK